MTTTPGDTVFRFFLISKVCLGVLGNSVLFVLYAYTSVSQPQLRKPIDMVFMHLALVNALTIMFQSMPYIISSYGVSCFWDDTTCKVVLYLFRVTRGLTICTTTFLSAYQALTISPAHAQWAWLKGRAVACILSSLVSFWVFNSVIYLYVIDNLKSNCNSTVTGLGFSHPYCETNSAMVKASSFICSIVIGDVLFLVLMITTSLYMVILLYQHHQRTRHLHSPSLVSQPAPTNKATHTILMLVSCFVFFYCSNNIVTIYSLYTPEKMSKSKGSTVILSSSYPTLCPYLLMKNNRIVSRWINIISLKITRCKSV